MFRRLRLLKQFESPLGISECLSNIKLISLFCDNFLLLRPAWIDRSVTLPVLYGTHVIRRQERDLANRVTVLITHRSRRLEWEGYSSRILTIDIYLNLPAIGSCRQRKKQMDQLSCCRCKRVPRRYTYLGINIKTG